MLRFGFLSSMYLAFVTDCYSLLFVLQSLSPPPLLSLPPLATLQLYIFHHCLLSYSSITASITTITASTTTTSNDTIFAAGFACFRRFASTASYFSLYRSLYCGCHCLQYPKDFLLISSFLPNKSAQDCVSFYYVSKPAAEYKQKLKAQSLALRKRAARNGWSLAVQAFEAVG